MVDAELSNTKVALLLPSWGATGAAHASEPPCQPSNQVSSPMTLAKDPSEPNLKISSNRHALVVTSSTLFDHQPIFPELGPTPRAAASGKSVQSPASTGSTVTVSSGGASAAVSVGIKENQLMFVPPDAASTLSV